VFFYVFGQFAIYRARRYRLTRTVWRGVRFWMSGSGWIYALQASLWGLFMLVTLWPGAAVARRGRSSATRCAISYYGDLQGSFEGRGWEFFKRGWWLWLLTPLAFCVPPLALFHLWRVQGGGMALVVVRHKVRGVRLESKLPRTAG